MSNISTYCKNGHPRTPENTTKQNTCRLCINANSRRSYAKKCKTKNLHKPKDGKETDVKTEDKNLPLTTSSGKIIPEPTEIENKLFPSRDTRLWKRFQPPPPEIDIDRAIRKYTARLKEFNAEMAAKGFVGNFEAYKLDININKEK